jgi:hypothetical protein
VINQAGDALHIAIKPVRAPHDQILSLQKAITRDARKNKIKIKEAENTPISSGGVEPPRLSYATNDLAYKMRGSATLHEDLLPYLGRIAAMNFASTLSQIIECYQKS